MAENNAGTAQYVIWVDFDVHPAQMRSFEMLLRENALDSLAHEPGCRRFDILTPEPSRSAISLYEIYDNEDAYKAHQKSSHYRSFAAAAAPAIRAKEVRSFHLQPLAARQENL